MALTWDKQLYDEMYRHPFNVAGQQVDLTYLWATSKGIGDRFAQFFFDHIAEPPGTLLVVGGGFGWSAEKYEELGFEVHLIDTSPHIQGAKGTSEASEIRAAVVAAGIDPDAGEGAAFLSSMLRPDTLGNARSKKNAEDENLSNNGSRKRVRGLFASGQIDFVLTEEVISTLTDSDLVTVLGWINSTGHAGTTYVHFTTPLDPIASFQDPRLTWKTMAGWRIFLDANGGSGHILVNTQGDMGIS